MMQKQTVTINVEKLRGKDFYSCYMVEEMVSFSLTGYGRRVREAIADLYVSAQEIEEMLASQGKAMPEMEYHFNFDIGSLFNYYDFLNISGVARRVGINASLMRRYAIGQSTPRTERKRHIEEVLRQLGRELQMASMR